MTARAKRGRRSTLMLCGLVAPVLVLAVIASCKEASVDAVVLDLGLANAGSLGFACTESPSTTCSEVLACVLKPIARDAQLACLNMACLQGDKPDRQCAKVAQCLRSDAGSTGECFNRTCGAQPPLVERAADGKGGADVHLIVEYIGLGGTPGCRVAELRGWCSTHACRPIRRACIAVHLEPGAMASAAAASKAISEGFAAGGTIDPDAPDEPVAVRVIGVAKTGACTADEMTPEKELASPLVGCAYSCPTVLSANRGHLTIDFDLLGAKCNEEALTECAGLFANDAGR